MAKNKKTISKGRSLERVLAEAKRRTLVQSTASSLRLAGVKVSDKDVGRVVGR